MRLPARIAAIAQVVFYVSITLVAVESCRPEQSLAPRTEAFAPGSVVHFTPLTITRIVINGPSKIESQGTYTWTASVTGATGAVSYQWQLSTDQGATWRGVGTNSTSYSRLERTDESFWLRVTATDSNSQFTSNNFKVDVVL